MRAVGRLGIPRSVGHVGEGAIMGSSSVVTMAGAVIASGRGAGRRTRALRRMRSGPVTDEAVLEQTRRLTDAYRSPSTALVVAALVGDDGVATASLQSAVRDALERLRVRGELVCVSHRGQHRWHLPGRPPPA